jgi:hypothetical protein
MTPPAHQANRRDDGDQQDRSPGKPGPVIRSDGPRGEYQNPAPNSAYVPDLMRLGFMGIGWRANEVDTAGDLFERLAG